MPNLFPRKLSLVIADEEGEGIDLGQLSAKFEIIRPSMSDTAIGRAKISVFNLSQTTLSKLTEKKYTQIRLDAGYPQRFGTLFAGQIHFAYPTWSGPDLLVEIFARDGGFDRDNAKVNVTFSGGTPLRDVVRTIGLSMIRTGIGSLDDLPDVRLIGSRTFSGMAMTQLNQLAADYRFVWTTINGVMHVLNRQRAAGGTAIEVSRETGMIDSPQASAAGIEVLTLLDPGIVPGRRVNVITAGASVVASDSQLSTVDQPVNARFRKGGRFDVNRVVHVGESRGQTWYTKFFAMPEGIVQ